MIRIKKYRSGDKPSFSDIAKWKIEVWDSCPVRIPDNNPAAKEIRYSCGFNGLDCIFENCPRRKEIMKQPVEAPEDNAIEELLMKKKEIQKHQEQGAVSNSTTN